MSNHIPPHLLLPQDMVDLYDHGPEDEPFKQPVKSRVHAVDAKHSMGVDPKRYAIEPRRPVPTLVEAPKTNEDEDEDDGE